MVNFGAMLPLIPYSGSISMNSQQNKKIALNRQFDQGKIY